MPVNNFSNPRQETAIEAATTPTMPVENLKIGDRVVDYSWEWEHRREENYTGGVPSEPVTWIVVGKNNYTVAGDVPHVTLLSEKLLARFVFDDSQNRGSNQGCNKWDVSGTADAIRGVRNFLNIRTNGYVYGLPVDTVFYNEFSSFFQDAVLETELPHCTKFDPFYMWDEARPWTTYETADRVFLLSKSDLGGEPCFPLWHRVLPYFNLAHTDGPRDEAELNKRRKAQYPGCPAGEEPFRPYWTRSPGSFFGHDVRIVDQDGTLRNDLPANDRDAYIRPAVNIRADTEVSSIPNYDGLYEMSGENFFSFKFEKKNNPTLPGDIIGEIHGHNNTIKVKTPYSVDVSELVATFELSPGARAYIGNVTQRSGNTANNYGEDIFYLIRSASPPPHTTWRVMTDGYNGTLRLDFLNIGERVIDRSWTWMHRAGVNYQGHGENKPITWIVAADNHYLTECGRPNMTLLSEEVIGRHNFDNKNAWSSNWGHNHWGESGMIDATSGLRPFLNSALKDGPIPVDYIGDGFFNSFNPNFARFVLVTGLMNETRFDAAGRWSNINPWNDYLTKDRVFVPSQTELGGGNDETTVIGRVWPYFEICHPDGPKNEDELTARLRSSLGVSTTAYWTRSPWDSSRSYVRTVKVDGTFGSSQASNIRTGVRPAMNVCGEYTVKATPDQNGVYEFVIAVPWMTAPNSPRLNVAQNKSWTVEFNKTPRRASVNDETVYVTDKYGETVPVNFGFNGNKMEVEPAGDYDREETYVLWIRDLRATDGTALADNMKMIFRIR